MADKIGSTDWTPPSGPFDRPEEFAGTDGSPEYPRFLEKLLLSIVLAHPDLNFRSQSSRIPTDPASKRRWRIRQAAAALVGSSGSIDAKDGPAPQEDLKIMFRAFSTRDAKGVPAPRPEDRCPAQYTLAALDASENETAPLDGETVAYSVRARIRAALNAENGDANEAEVQRLASRFHEYQPYLISLFNELDGAYREELAMLESLKRIAEELGKWGVKAELDVVKLGLAALWDEQA